MPELLTVRRDGPPLVHWLSVGEPSEYQHTFGGPPRHRGVTPAGGPRPWHLLFSIDLTDPRLELRIPGVRWLPLYNAFQYDSSLIQYRAVSDDAVDIVYQDRFEFTPHFPYSGFPVEFPLLPVAVKPGEPITFDEENQESWWDLFCDEGDGWETQARSPSRNELCALKAGVNQIEFAGHTQCRNCGTMMDMLAAFRDEFAPEPISIWGGGEDVAIVYQVCPNCYTICGSNLAN